MLHQGSTSPLLVLIDSRRAIVCSRGLCCLWFCVAQAAGLRWRRLWSGLPWFGYGLHAGSLFHFLPLSPAINASDIWRNICRTPCIVWCTCQGLVSFETLICARLRACGCLFQRRTGPRALRLWVRWTRRWKWSRVSSLQSGQAAVIILSSRWR